MIHSKPEPEAEARARRRQSSDTLFKFSLRRHSALTQTSQRPSSLLLFSDLYFLRM
jgi:hypothetical protein